MLDAFWLAFVICCALPTLVTFPYIRASLVLTQENFCYPSHLFRSARPTLWDSLRATSFRVAHAFHRDKTGRHTHFSGVARLAPKIRQLTHGVGHRTGSCASESTSRPDVALARTGPLQAHPRAESRIRLYCNTSQQIPLSRSTIRVILG